MSLVQTPWCICNKPNIFTQCPRSNLDIRSLIKRWILYVLLFYLRQPPEENRRTRNRCNKHRWSVNLTCLLQRAEIQVNKYKCGTLSTKAEVFPENLFWNFFTNHNTGNYLRHGNDITTNQRLFPTLRGNGNTINDGDSKTSLHPIFFWKRGDVCTQASL